MGEKDGVVDLDILRPEKKTVRLRDKIIDVSFIPVGITFEIDNIVRELMKLNQTEIQSGGNDTKKALDLTIKLCATYTQIIDPEMNEDWFKKNVDAKQAGVMADILKDTLLKSYEGVREYGSKN